MIINAEKIRIGSVIFVGGNSLLSVLIRMLSKSKFSHVALHIGEGKIIEAMPHGVEINALSHYLADSTNVIEVITPPITEEQARLMVDEAKKHYQEHYDYRLFFGHFLFRIFHMSRKYLGMWNKGDSWICSELVANSLKKAGCDLKFPGSWIEPEDLHKALHKLIKETQHGPGKQDDPDVVRDSGKS